MPLYMASFFIDPPYIAAGPSLYRYGMTQQKHLELAARLRVYPHPWCATYDADPLVYELYNWAEVATDSYRYSMAGSQFVRVGKTLPSWC